MSAVLIVTNDNEAQRLIPWATLLARADSKSLHVIVTQEKEGDREWEETTLREPTVEDEEEPNEDSAAVLESAVRRLAGLDNDESSDPVEIEVTIHRLKDPTPDRALQQLLPKLGARLLILPLDEMVRESEKEWKGRLYRASTCETIYLRAAAGKEVEANRILVPTAGGTNASAALRRADLIAKENDGEVTSLYVQQNAGELTNEVGERVLERNVRRAIGRRRGETARQVVVVGNNVIDGIEGTMSQAPQLYDLVMIGAYRHRTIRKIFFGKLANDCFSGENSPAFAAVRAGLPLGSRFQQFCERQVQQYIPQLDRESRVALVERVQTSSNWNFDFIALICLSTCIAALGLVRNQAAVVIGAMLVAPLMTPLAASGLALVQGNGALIKSSLKSVLFGFLLAYAIGVIVGVCFPLGVEDSIPPELVARTSPGIVDLLVALVGGVAAAYAMSRPHLSSALPGVAIAAALVPPIATSGIMLAWGEWAFSRGSVLLFLTNIVAIVLGTAISLRLVGIRDAHHHGTTQRWTRRFAALLLALVVGLGFIVSHSAPRTGHAAIDSLREQIGKDVKEFGATLISATKTGQSELAVIVESPNDDLGVLPNKIHEMAVKELADEKLKVKLEVRHVIEVAEAAE